MESSDTHSLLTVISLEDEKIGWRRVPEVVISRAKKLQLSGTTVVRERSPADHRGALKRLLFPHRPTVLEIVERDETLDAVIDQLLEGIPDSVVVMRKRVEVLST